MRTHAIVATGYAGEIGCRGAIPWQGQLPRDMRYFMDMTRESNIIMGRVTADSLKLPLKTRTSIIITTRVNETLERYGEHSIVVNSLDAAMIESRDRTPSAYERKTFIIGGSQIYRAAMEQGLIDVMYLTTVHANFKHADTFFNFDKTNYDITGMEHHAPDEKNAYGCTFETYQKRLP